MTGFWSRLFGGERTQPTRKFSHPEHLREGDILKFGYLPQTELSNTQFEVSKINTYVYGDLCYPELILKDREGNLFYMMVEEEDGEEYLAVCKKIQKTDVAAIIDERAMEEILRAGIRVSLPIRTKPKGLEEWLADSYDEVDDNVGGAFVKGDARYLSEAEFRQRDRFTSFVLEDPSGEFAIEIEKYLTGEIEVCATIYLEISAIDEMWPAHREASTVSTPDSIS